MHETCKKLSGLVSPKENQVFGEYLKDLYPVYQKKIAAASLSFHGKPVRVFTELNCQLQHQTFEHLTTKGNEDRLYNQKRCERLAWINDILTDLCNNCIDCRIFRDTAWRAKKSASRYIIWCTQEDYVIVLEERQKEVMLITAYCVLYKSKREELENKYQNSLKK